MRKLGGYEAAEKSRVRGRSVSDKRAVAAKRAVAEKRTVADNRAAAVPVAGVPALGDIREIISGRWDVRFNALDNNLEARPAGGGDGAAFEPLTERTHNSMANCVQEVYPLCFRSKIDSYLFSDEVPSFNPLRAYLLGLPAWDGTDRIGELAARVSDDGLWTRVFRTWLRGAVKGWMQEEGGAAPRVFDCQTAPLLVSERQGLGKSTFCRMLLPECLRMYYSDKFDLSSDSHSEKLLGQFALINMDEFDRYSERQMGVLKNLMQLTDVKMRRPRSRGLSEVRRVAAFIGTSNYSELLADPTGSRRFFCQVVERPISNAPIDYKQLYAQVVAEIQAGEPTFFSKEEEAEIEAHNKSFYRESPLADAYRKSFAAGGGQQEWLSANEIFEILKRESPKALQGVTIARLGKQLRQLGVTKRHTVQGNLYGVCRRE